MVQDLTDLSKKKQKENNENRKENKKQTNKQTKTLIIASLSQPWDWDALNLMLKLPKILSLSAL